jgi:hypothetical protein
MCMSITVSGIVSRRSSIKQPHGPPGERDIQELNPERRERILEITGWARLVPGSLNLEVSDDALELLLTLEPAITEPSGTIVYPAPYQHIPLLRKAYFYYLAEARAHGKQVDVVARRAEVPPYSVVELFAADSIRDVLEVGDGDIVEVALGLEDDLLQTMQRDAEENRRAFSRTPVRLTESVGLLALF